APLGDGGRRHARALPGRLHRGHALDRGAGEPCRRDRASHRAAEGRSGARGADLGAACRPARGPRARRAPRHAGLPQPSRAARGDRGDLGRQAAAARALCRSALLRRRTAEDRALRVVDVHTHMLNEAYIRLLKKHGRHYSVKKVVGGQTGIHRDGAPFMTLMPGMFDYETRIRAMDEAGVDIAIVTLTSPNVYWGSAKISLFASKLINDDMAAQQKRYPQRIRFMCSLP